MGVLKLMDFIRKKFPNAIKSTTVASYQNKTLAIDTSNWIYQFLIKTQSNSNCMQASNKEMLAFLQTCKGIWQVIWSAWCPESSSAYKIKLCRCGCSIMPLQKKSGSNWGEGKSWDKPQSKKWRLQDSKDRFLTCLKCLVGLSQLQKVKKMMRLSWLS